LEEMETDPTDWFLILRLITEKNPVPEHASLDEAISAWKQWWEENKYFYGRLALNDYSNSITGS
jgi:hypothetical protein